LRWRPASLRSFAAGHLISGHTLEHLAAAAACWTLVHYFTTRRPLPALRR